ncbi:MAG: ABC transporter permease [Halobacteriovoraceae bacterium]|nr:ABC transporter permease [Halobacteriovoraceae bacterium]
MNNKKNSLWLYAFHKLKKDRLNKIALAIVLSYIVISFLSATGIIASNWAKEVGDSYVAPNSDHWLGTDIFGRSVLAKVIKGAEVAITVGFFASLLSVVIGLTLGALAGYFEGIVDELIVWFYTVFNSIPGIMLLIAMTFVLEKGLVSVCLALGLTSWVGLCRLTRGEVLKHKQRDYVHAASAVGGSDMRKLCRHIIPNVFHIVIINFSLQFQYAIKSEVVLSYLGLGVQERPSWGVMIDDAKLELARGVWWQLTAATIAMLIIVLAFNILGDALRDALDPKLKGK